MSMTKREAKERMAMALVYLIICVIAFLLVDSISYAAGSKYNCYTDIPLSEEVQRHMMDVCSREGVSYDFCLAMMESESDFDPDAVGDEGRSIGYFQISRINWNRMKSEYGLDVHDPMDNIEAGVIMIRELCEKYDDPYRVILAYKAGETRGKELYNAGRFKTAEYDVYAICDRAIQLEKEHRK